jgi:tyrosine-specific transport protein
MFKGKYLLAIFTLVGTIIGAGIFGLPYIASKAGILLTFFYMVLIVVVSFLIHSFFAEIILRTKKKLLLPGLAKEYLGKGARIIVSASLVFGVVGSLFAYILLSSSFFKILTGPFIDLPEKLLAVIIWGILSFLVFLGIKTISKVELILNLLFITIVVGFLFFSLPKMEIVNFTLFNLKESFLPFGVVMFSFFGLSAIPCVLGILKTPKERANIGKVLKIALAICFMVYLIFILIIVGVSGRVTSQDSFTGLIPFLGQNIVLLGAFFGLITCATSFLVVANYLRDTLSFDFNIPVPLAFIITCGTPLLLVFSGIFQFIEAIGLVGSIMGMIEGIIIIMIFKKIKKVGTRMPEYTFKPFSFVFWIIPIILIIGVISQLIYFF